MACVQLSFAQYVTEVGAALPLSMRSAIGFTARKAAEPRVALWYPKPAQTEYCFHQGESA